MMKVLISKCVTVVDNNRALINGLMAEGFTVEFLPTVEEAAPKAAPKVAPKAVRIRRKRRRAPNVTADQLKQMIELRKKGLTHRIIARRFGLSTTGSANAIRKAQKGAA